jgi:hypothetical protein
MQYVTCFSAGQVRVLSTLTIDGTGIAEMLKFHVHGEDSAEGSMSTPPADGQRW